MKTHVERLPEFYLDGDKKISNKRMLVIDDEIKIREMYRQIFVAIGYEVLSVGNAIEANDILVRSKFDIVLLDINMSEVDGSTLFEVMRTFHKDIKVVVSSVYSINEQKDFEGAKQCFRN